MNACSSHAFLILCVSELTASVASLRSQTPSHAAIRTHSRSTTTARSPSSSSCSENLSNVSSFAWSLSQKLLQSEIFPHDLFGFLRSLLDSKRGVLIWYDIILVFGVDGLVLRRQEDLVWEQRCTREVFEKVGVPGRMEVEVRARRVARLVQPRQ